MGNEFDKEKRSKRIHNEESKIKKQVEIGKQMGLDFNNELIRQPHRLSKRHFMDCGNPRCILCSNPRHNKMFKEKLTIQEQRFYQEKLYDESEPDMPEREL